MNELLRRASFSDSAITTVSPTRIVVMCFERIDRDLEGCIAALGANQRATANELAIHAQDIVSELLASLDQNAWEHAPRLASIYSWALQELINANIRRDAAAIAEVRTVLAELKDGFVTAAAAPAAPSAGGGLSAKA